MVTKLLNLPSKYFPAIFPKRTIPTNEEKISFQTYGLDSQIYPHMTSTVIEGITYSGRGKSPQEAEKNLREGLEKRLSSVSRERKI